MEDKREYFVARALESKMFHSSRRGLVDSDQYFEMPCALPANTFHCSWLLDLSAQHGGNHYLVENRVNGRRSGNSLLGGNEHQHENAWDATLKNSIPQDLGNRIIFILDENGLDLDFRIQVNWIF